MAPPYGDWMVSYRTTKEHLAEWGAACCQRQQPSRTTGTASRATAKTRSKKLSLLQCKVFLQISDPAMAHANGTWSTVSTTLKPWLEELQAGWCT